MQSIRIIVGFVLLVCAAIVATQHIAAFEFSEQRHRS